MFKFLDQLFSKTPPPELSLKSATIELTCGILLPPAYEKAGRVIAQMGLRGMLQMTKEGKIRIDLEGPLGKIEELERRLTDEDLFGPRCKDHLVWRPYENKYTKFGVLPLFGGRPPVF